MVPPTLKDRVCPCCKKTYTPKSPLSIYCSPKCGTKHWKQRNSNRFLSSKRGTKKQKPPNPYNARYQKQRDEYRRRNLEKAAIYSRVWYWNQKLPPMEKCEHCGSTDKDDLVRHHPDYSKPYETVTLCHGCHAKLHAEEKQIESK